MTAAFVGAASRVNRKIIGMLFIFSGTSNGLKVGTYACGLRAVGVLSLSAEKLPSSQQATKHSVTDFNSSQRARITLASLLLIWLSAAAVAITARRSANSCTIWLVAGIR